MKKPRHGIKRTYIAPEPNGSAKRILIASAHDLSAKNRVFRLKTLKIIPSRPIYSLSKGIYIQKIVKCASTIAKKSSFIVKDI